MKDQKRSIPAPLMELVIILVIALLIWIFVDVSIESIIQDKAGSCVSVVFDKPWVKGADRVIVYQDGQVVADISDREEVRQLADLFTVANCTDQCDYKSGWRMEIYNGDRLVREVIENCCGGLYMIYERDLLHWVFPSECGTGQVELSVDEEQRLKEIIERYKYK